MSRATTRPAIVACSDKIVKLINGWSFNESAFLRDAAKISAGVRPQIAPRKLTDSEFDDNQYSIENGDGAIY